MNEGELLNAIHVNELRAQIDAMKCCANCAHMVLRVQGGTSYTGEARDMIPCCSLSQDYKFNLEEYVSARGMTHVCAEWKMWNEKHRNDMRGLPNV